MRGPQRPKIGQGKVVSMRVVEFIQAKATLLICGLNNEH